MRDRFSDKVTENNWWRKAVFALGILAVIGAVVYSLVIRQADSAGSPPTTGTAPTLATSCNSAPISSGISELNWVKNTNTKFADHDLIFVVLPGSADATQKIYQEIDGAAVKIKADGITIDTMTLNTDDPEVAITAQRLAISKLPAVIAFSKSGSGAIVSGDITETKLLQAYLIAAKACVPSSSSGCCP